MRSIEILLVEDNPGDVLLTREAFSESRISNNLHIVMDGESAIAFLERKGQFATVPMPDLILLDLNLPKLNGREVLDRIKTHVDWRVIPVIALTTSTSSNDIWASYSSHVNCYMVKPMSLVPFMDVIRRIEDFWMSSVKLPTRSI